MLSAHWNPWATRARTVRPLASAVRATIWCIPDTDAPVPFRLVVPRSRLRKKWRPLWAPAVWTTHPVTNGVRSTRSNESHPRSGSERGASAARAEDRNREQGPQRETPIAVAPEWQHRECASRVRSMALRRVGAQPVPVLWDPARRRTCATPRVD